MGNTKIGKTKKRDVFFKTDGMCAYCGKELDPFLMWHVDHVIPSSRGGDNSLFNLLPSCRSCNIRKNNKTPIEFKRWFYLDLFEVIFQLVQKRMYTGVDVGLITYDRSQAVIGDVFDALNTTLKNVKDELHFYYEDIGIEVPTIEEGVGAQSSAKGNNNED